MLFSLSGSIFAQSLLSGTYTCKTLGGPKVSDGRGSSAKFISGNVKVDDNNNISLSSRVTFTVVGRKPKVETLTVSGSGKLSNYQESDGDATASTVFSVKPSKKVVYRKLNLTGTFRGSLDRNSNELITVSSINSYVKTPIGIVRLVCAK